MKKKITICEVGPRDGLQNEKKILEPEVIAGMINDCIDAGFQSIEYGSYVHPKAIPSLAKTEEVFNLVKKDEDLNLRVLITNLRGAQRAAENGSNHVKLACSASNSHNMSNFNRSSIETVQSFKETVSFSRDKGMYVSGAISTSFGCPFEGKIDIETIEKIVDEYIALDIKEISLSDTTGMAHPKQVKEICGHFVNKYPDIIFHAHFHNTRDMGMANVTAAIEAGIRNFDSSFGGLGGCPYAPGASGNLCTEDLVHMLHEMDYETGIDLDKAIEIARKVQEIFEKKLDSYMLKAGKSSDLIKKPVVKQNNK
jgi:hydroxymethylglutaryl-CoA lyase